MQIYQRGHKTTFNSDQHTWECKYYQDISKESGMNHAFLCSVNVKNVSLNNHIEKGRIYRMRH